MIGYICLGLLLVHIAFWVKNCLLRCFCIRGLRQDVAQCITDFVVYLPYLQYSSLFCEILFCLLKDILALYVAHIERKVAVSLGLVI